MPDLGWVGFDAANGLYTTDAHARVAIGLDYLGAAPVRGTRYGGGAETLTVAVRVEQAGRRASGRASSRESRYRSLHQLSFRGSRSENPKCIATCTLPLDGSRVGVERAGMTAISPSLIQPHVLEAQIVVLAVVVRPEILHMGLPAIAGR